MSANITDIAALDEFRRALIKFREEIGVAVAEADSEVKSTFVWLERDRMLHWRRMVPRLDEELTGAKGALYRKEMQTMGTGKRPSVIDEKKAVERAKRRAEDARERLEKTRRWLATLDRDVSLFKGAMSPISTMIDRDLPDAILRLRNMALALEAYLATPTVTLGEQLERARTKVASMRRGGEMQSAEEEAQADRERAELESDERALAAARDEALRTIGRDGSAGPGVGGGAA
jgi:small-conductance mechanosensitive channel